MKIVEITRPKNSVAASNILIRHGYVQLGSTGAFGRVFAKPDEPYVLKLFNAQDSSYLQYLKLITTVQNPHFPIVKGKPMKITDKYWGVRLERLEPITGNNNQLLDHIVAYILRYSKLKFMERIKYRYAMGKQGPYDDREDVAAGTKIAAERQKLHVFEEHYPELATACRLINDYVLRGDNPDLHDENVMQRGPTLVITDPAAYTEDFDLNLSGTTKQPDLFPTKPSWNDQQIHISRDKVDWQKLPDELSPQPASRGQKEFGYPRRVAATGVW